MLTPEIARQRTEHGEVNFLNRIIEQIGKAADEGYDNKYFYQVPFTIIQLLRNDGWQIQIFPKIIDQYPDIIISW